MIKKFITFILILFILIWFAFFTIKNNLLDLSLKQIPKIEKSFTDSLTDVVNIEKQIYNPPPLVSSVKNDNNNSFLTEDGVLKWTNIKRDENGSLTTLTENDLLDIVAGERLDDMFGKQYFEHISPDGIGVSDIAKKDGYEFITIGENIALGNFKDDQALVQAWMDSPGHRANILNARYAEIGIAVRKGRYKGEETWLGIQVFGLPLSSCPSTDETLKTKIDSNKARISDMERSADNARDELDAAHPKTNEDARIYNEKVREYNKIIAAINPLIDETKDLISKFNAQVDSFNSCAEGR